MNAWEKLQLVRQLMSKADLKKTGENRFSKYNYYTLDDLLPTLTQFLHDQKLVTSFEMNADEAIYRVINAEKPDEEIVFTCPTVMAEMKGSSKIQELGATLSYCHRYLVLLAFSICEVEWVEMDREAQDKEKAERNTTARDNRAKQESKAQTQAPVIPAGEALNFITQVWQAGNYPMAKLNDWIIKQANGKPITEEWLTELGVTLDKKLTEKLKEKQ